MEKLKLLALLASLVYIAAFLAYSISWTASAIMSYDSKVQWLASDPQAMARTVVSLNIFGGGAVSLVMLLMLVFCAYALKRVLKEV